MGVRPHFLEIEPELAQLVPQNLKGPHDGGPSMQFMSCGCLRLGATTHHAQTEHRQQRHGDQGDGGGFGDRSRRKVLKGTCRSAISARASVECETGGKRRSPFEQNIALCAIPREGNIKSADPPAA